MINLNPNPDKEKENQDVQEKYKMADYFSVSQSIMVAHWLVWPPNSTIVQPLS